MDSQSNIILGAITLGFIVFITVKGELPAYAAIFTTSSVGATSLGSVGSNVGGFASGLGGAESTLIPSASAASVPELPSVGQSVSGFSSGLPIETVSV